MPRHCPGLGPPPPDRKAPGVTPLRNSRMRLPACLLDPTDFATYAAVAASAAFFPLLTQSGIPIP